MVVVLLIAVALVFDFMNGFHDAANSVATVVSTRVLTPRQAVLWAAFFNFVAAFGFGVHVANTVGKGIIEPSAVTNTVVFAGLAAAIAWDVLTWLFGLPTSSSHALIAGFAGAGVAAAGPQVVIVSGLTKVILFIFISPALGLILGLFFMTTGDVLRAPQHSRPCRQHVSAAATGFGGILQSRPRHQRRAENDGNHHRAAVHRPVTSAPRSTSPCG